MKYLGKKSAAVRRISPGDAHYFFGYYDLQPYSADETKHLIHKTTFRNRLPEKYDVAEIGYIDMQSEEFVKLGDTRAWNFQQGAMLQWNPKAPDREIIYNDFLNGEFCGVIMDIETGKKRFLDRPVANVSRDGNYALSINMARLFDFRPGYGYCAKADSFYYRNHSDKDGVFLIDMNTGKSEMVLSLDEIWEFTKSFFATDQKMIINHITFNPSASRFIMLVRNFPVKGQRHATALVTANRDGSDMYLLSDYGLQSHYWWINDEDIIFLSDAKELECSQGLCNTYVFKDKTHDGYILADGFFWADNHMSINSDGTLMITDSYPAATSDSVEGVYINEHSLLHLYDLKRDVCAAIGYFHSLPNSTGDVRCDLHPRFNRSGNGITFDSTHEGFRGVYKIDLDSETVDKLLK